MSLKHLLVLTEIIELVRIAHLIIGLQNLSGRSGLIYLAQIFIFEIKILELVLIVLILHRINHSGLVYNRFVVLHYLIHFIHSFAFFNRLFQLAAFVL